MSRRPNLPTHTPTTISTRNTQQSSLLIIIQNLTHWNSTWTKNHKILLLSDFFDIKYRSVVGNIFQEIRLESQKPFSSLPLPPPTHLLFHVVIGKIVKLWVRIHLGYSRLLAISDSLVAVRNWFLKIWKPWGDSADCRAVFKMHCSTLSCPNKDVN